MIRVKNKKTHVFMLVLLLILGIGFAALAANLKINGTVNIDSASWDVHFENVTITEGSVEANPAPTSNNVDTTEMTYGINFEKPGDFFEFTVDMANDGSIDAMINLVTNETFEADGTTPKNLPDYLTSSVTYNDGVPIVQNQLLTHNTSEKIKVRVEFRTDINSSDLPDTADIVVFKFSGNFKQADSNACPKPTTFADDSWETIQCNVKNNTASYPVGAEKEINLTNFGTHTIRVANNTTPNECSTEGFSQSACGFVIEFADVITTCRMNPWVSGTVHQNGNGNYGGWEYSEIRTFISNTIYSALPLELRNVIIETSVVSSHGSDESNNFVTTDKLYLFSTKEVWGKEGTANVINNDSAETETRQLDYYYNKGVTTDYSKYKEAIKKNLNGINSTWWLRSALLDYNSDFFTVDYNGNHSSDSSNYTGDWISPAFRIG